MPKRSTRTSLVFITIILFLAQGCRSMQPIENGNDYSKVVGQVKARDVIRITTTSGEVHKIRVKSVTEEKIIGKDIEVAFADISRIEVRKTDREKKKEYIRDGIVLGSIVVILYTLAVLFHVIETK